MCCKVATVEVVEPLFEWPDLPLCSILRSGFDWVLDFVTPLEEVELNWLELFLKVKVVVVVLCSGKFYMYISLEFMIKMSPDLP